MQDVFDLNYYFCLMKKALLQLHLAVLLWGFTGVLGKLISLDAVVLVWWRMLLAAAGFWLLFLFQAKPVKLAWKDIGIIAGNGTILALHWVCFYASIKMSNVSVALTCLATSGLFSALAEPLLNRRRVDPAELLFGFLALAGVGIIYYNNLLFSTGIYVGLLSSLLTVLVSVINKKFTAVYQPDTIAVYQLSGGFVGLTLLLPFFFKGQMPVHFLPSGSDWLWLIFLSWLCTMVTFSLYIRALKKVTAFTVNLSLTLEPVYGIALAFLFFREDKTFDYTFYIGFVFIIMAVLMELFIKVRKHKKDQMAMMN